MSAGMNGCLDLHLPWGLDLWGNGGSVLCAGLALGPRVEDVC